MMSALPLELELSSTEAGGHISDYITRVCKINKVLDDNY